MNIVGDRQHTTQLIAHATSSLQRYVLQQHQKGIDSIHRVQDKPIIWLSYLGQLLALQMKQIVPTELLASALQAVTEIDGGWKKHKKNVESFKLGTWASTGGKGGKDTLYPILPLSPEDAKQRVLIQLENIAKVIGEILYKAIASHPSPFAAGLLTIPSLLGDKAYFHISSTLYVNRMTSQKGPTKPHLDDHDCYGCLVVPFGDFTGGDLSFPQLGQRVELSAGDCLWFDSSQLEHYNETVTTGIRYSMIFATHTQVLRILLNIPPQP